MSVHRAASVGVVAIALAVSGCSRSERVSFESRAVSVAGQSGGGPTTTAAPRTAGGLLPGGAPAPTVAGGPATAAPGRPPPASAPPPSGGVVKLGTILPLQGGERDFGEPVLRTTQAFVDEVNARGGVNGNRVQLVAYSACLICQEEALQAARRLVEQDGVFALVNTYTQVIAFQPVIPYLVEKGVPLIQGGSLRQTSDALSPVNFATAPPGLFYARFLPKMVKVHAGIAKVAVTHLDTPTEAHGIPILVRELEREGVEVVDVVPVEAAEEAVTNMDAIVTRVRTRGAEGVVATNPVLVIYGRLAASRQRWEVPWVGVAAWSHLVEDGCGATCDDLVLTESAGLSFIDRDSPQMRQYRETLGRRYPGGRLTGHTLAAWVGMQLTVEVLARLPAGPPERTTFLRTLESIRNLDLGTTSPLTFGPDRHLGGTASTLLKLAKGKYVRASDPLNYGEAPP